ncbi:MAG: hypothetical protein IT379_29885 [Deltaproteobacteria bacterium]|nr:hypothetical protein [Deltaproteobacteria bacterium]
MVAAAASGCDFQNVDKTEEPRVRLMDDDDPTTPGTPPAPGNPPGSDPDPTDPPPGPGELPGLPAPPEDPGSTPPAPPPADPSDPCMGLDYLGVCEGATARWCEGGQLKSRDCAREGLGCGWVDDTTGYYCGGSGDRPDAPPPTTPPSTPPPTTPPPAPPPSTGCGNAIEQEELALTNMARASSGLGPLECDPLLTEVARAHSQDMCDRGYFDHTSLDGRSPFDRMRDAGVRYGTAGENIAWGQRTPDEVHDAWMNSSGHRANILGGDYNRIGIGYVECGGMPLWTQNFTD